MISKGCMAVVIQTPHQPRIEPKRNPQGSQTSLHLLKTLTAGISTGHPPGLEHPASSAWVSLFLESRIRNGLVLRRLPGNLDRGPQTAARAKQLKRCGRPDDPPTVPRLLSSSCKPPTPRLASKIPGQRNHFNIAASPLRPKPLHPDLMKLPLPALPEGARSETSDPEYQSFWAP